MIPFSPPRIDQKVIDEVVDTLRSGWITTGPKTKMFEKELQDYCGCKRVLCVNSATAGMELVLRWFGVKEGDEVILPAYTYSSTANVVVHCGATPVLADIGHDLNMDVSKLKGLINTRTKVIMPVDIGGLPCDYEALSDLVNDPEITCLFDGATDVQQKLGRVLLLSDSAHSLGARCGDKVSGTFADVSVFSFHAVKNLTTAEGGAIAMNLPDRFDHEELYRYLNIFSLHGQTKDALSKMKGGNWKYDIIEAGYKCNMTDIQASIGLVEIGRYDSETLPRRRQICSDYTDSFRDHTWAEVPVQETASCRSSYHLYPLRIKGINEEQRDHIIKDLYEHGVSVNVHFIPIPMLSYYKSLGYRMSDYPSAYDSFSREISLPVFYDLTDEQVREVVAKVVQSVEKELAIA